VNSLARLTGCCMVECARADSEIPEVSLYLPSSQTK
jgi:hypothetical protein